MLTCRTLSHSRRAFCTRTPSGIISASATRPPICCTAASTAHIYIYIYILNSQLCCHLSLSSQLTLQHTVTQYKILQHNRNRETINLQLCRLLRLSSKLTVENADVCCNRLQQTATDCNRLQQTATHECLPDDTPSWRSIKEQHDATYCNTLQHAVQQKTSTHCNILQHNTLNKLKDTAIHCNTRQYTAIHCNTL